MPTLSLQFSSMNDFGSGIIRYFSHGTFSHVDLIESSGRLYGARSDILAGVPAGVQSRPSNYSTFAATKVVSLTLTEDQIKAAWDFLYSQKGKPYDKMAILGFMIGRNWREDDAWVCSELASRALELCKFFPYPLANTSAKITPDDLLLILSAMVNIN